MKRPSFQFYPSDWLRDTALRSCSTGARGLWMDMICFMHEGTPYGHLKVGDKVILPSNLARMVGDSIEVVSDWLIELSQAGVYEKTDEGVIYSKRMIRDENLRIVRAAGGIKGGNPALMDKNKVNLKDKQNTTPSSSSSSSSSSSISKKEIKPKASTIVECPSFVSVTVWHDFLRMRKTMNKPFSETALKLIIHEAEKAGWSLENALAECCARGWQSFKADWVKDKTLSKTGQTNQTVMSGLTRGLVGGGSNVKLLSR